MTAEQLEDAEGRDLVLKIHARKAGKIFAAAFQGVVDDVAATVEALGRWNLIAEPPPADPRERALWAKQNRGTGPKPDSLRKRGRTVNYRAGR